MSRVVFVSADLFFRSKVEQVAELCGGAVDVAVSVDAALRLVDELRPRWVLVDLELDDALRLIGDVKSRRGVRTKIVAYGSHVEKALLAAAKDAGADEAVPRSVFVARLQGIFSGEPSE